MHCPISKGAASIEPSTCHGVSDACNRRGRSFRGLNRLRNRSARRGRHAPCIRRRVALNARRADRGLVLRCNGFGPRRRRQEQPDHQNNHQANISFDFHTKASKSCFLHILQHSIIYLDAVSLKRIWPVAVAAHYALPPDRPVRKLNRAAMALIALSDESNTGIPAASIISIHFSSCPSIAVRHMANGFHLPDL